MIKQFHTPSYTPKRSENRHSNNCIQMCTAVQFTTAKKQKPKCPSTNERTNCSLTIQWCIIQSQKGMMLQGQTSKTRCPVEGPTHTIWVCEMPLTQRIQNKQIHRDCGSHELRRGQNEERFPSEMIKMLWHQIEVVVTQQHCECFKCH